MPFDFLPPEAQASASHLLALLAGAALPQPTGYHVLAVQYIRPQKSSGGIIFADKSKSEDKWQGRVGLVLALGPDAYSDTAKFPSGPWCKPGDFIVWPAVEAATSRIEYGQRGASERAVLVMIPDDRVLLTGVDPEIVVGTS